MLGRTLSHYRILERLGAGGMGEVFLAQDTRLERPVALKTLPACRREDEGERRRLLDEARLASALNHPSIAVVYEVDEVATEEGPLALLAMEYVPGLPIDEWVLKTAPELDRRLAVAADIARALAHAHARGIVHRDVKPSNLLVGDDGRVKVLDFGLAQRRPPVLSEAVTMTGERGRDDAAIAGTLGYMAPEQALGRPVDARADAFAFGVVLYQLLTGEHPFPGATSWEVAGSVLYREPPPLVLAGEEGRAAALATLVGRLLAKEAADRPARLDEVASELDSIRRGSAEGVAAGAGQGVAVLGFDNLTGDAEDDWIGVGLAETIAADLARLEGLGVIARERVAEALRRAGGGDAGAGREARLARGLGARWAVAGAIQRLGESVRVTLRLLDLANGTVESLKLDARLAEIFALQDRAVAELSRRLSGRPAAAAPDEETTVVAAYEALAKGLLNFRTESFEGLARATVYFERAVALDPRYARAHLELGVALTQMGEYLVARDLHERALASVASARRLRPEWARAHRETGAILVALGREEEGIAALERALELAAEEPSVLAGLGRAYFLGRADFAGAARWFERALAANPHAGWYWLQLAHCRTLLYELDPARAAAERAIELQEKFLSGRDGTRIVGAHMRLGHVAARAGRPREAVEQYQRELAFLAGVDHALRGRITIELHLRLGAALQELGQSDSAAASFAVAHAAWEHRLALGADEPFTRFYAAAVHALSGDPERAILDLERAAAERRRYTIERARREPEFASLHAHPRFRALIGS